MFSKSRSRQSYCPHCSTKRTNHVVQRFDYYVDKFVWNFCIAIGSNVLNRLKNGERYLLHIVLKSLSIVRLVKFVDEPDQTKFCNRSFIFFKEAKKRGLAVQAVEIFGRHTLIFRWVHNNKNYYYSGTPLSIKPPNPVVDNKIKVKAILQERGVPTAEGKIFTSFSKAFDYGGKLGYPLVVKPNNSSLSHHVTCGIRSDKELIEAIRIAQIYKPDFIVEKYIYGNLYRATVVGKKYVYICQKELANVVGDGKTTIEKLIKIKNEKENRGEARQKHITLKKIPINNILKKNLDSLGLNLKSVLPKGKKIFLQDKYILSHGCDIVNCRDKTHKDNKKLFLKIAELLNADLIGIDFICPDIKKTYKNQKTAVLETNSFPYIDMHQFPSSGRSEMVAEQVWDLVLTELDK